MSKLNYSQVKKVLWFIMIANFTVAGIKIAMGLLIKSSGITADGFHSLSDGSSNIIGLIGIALAAKPIDKCHPYGHRKYETITGLFIAGMLGYLGIKIIIQAFVRFADPIKPHITLENLLLMVIALCINLLVCIYEGNKGKTLNSMILVSDAMHTRSDIYVTIGVIVSLLAIKLGAPPIMDPLCSLVVSGFILHAAYEIYKTACGILVDSSVLDTEKIEQIVLAQVGVKGVHKIRSRGMVDELHIDMHVLADSDLNLRASHDLSHRIENAFKRELNNNVEVTVHLEPYL